MMRHLSNSMLLLASLVIVLFMVETGLRLAGVSFPNFSQFDPVTGISLRPGAFGWSRTEGEAFVQINSDGLRDKQHSKLKPRNTFRIAVLGDSYAAAFQVPMELTFWHIMEQRLQQCPAFQSRKIEAINFGVSGYGTALEYLTLQHRVWSYSPDVVLLAFFTGNDVSDNSRALSNNDDVPYYVYEDNRLVVDNSFLNSQIVPIRASFIARALSRVSDYSYLLQLARESLHVARHGFPKRNRSRVGYESGLDNAIYKEPHSREWKDAWIVTEEILREMHREVRQHGAQFAVVTLSNGIQVYADPVVRATFMTSEKIVDLFYPDRRIKAVGYKEGVPVLNLAPILQAYADRYRIFLHGFTNTQLGTGHWNENGHRLAGEILGQWFCSDLDRVWLSQGDAYWAAARTSLTDDPPEHRYTERLK